MTVSSGMGTCTDSDDLNVNLSLSFGFDVSLVSLALVSLPDWTLSRGVFGVIGFRRLIRVVDVSIGFAFATSSKLTTVFGSFGCGSRFVVVSTTVLMLSSLFSDFSNCDRFTIFVRMPSKPHSNIM